MAKVIIKEIIIILLLCLAIILLLGILLYNYVPMSKTLPNPVSYVTAEDVGKELAEASTIDESQVIMTYEIDSTDLNNLKRVQTYKPGKAHPFSPYEEQAGNAENGNSSTGGETTGNTVTSNTTVNITSGGTLYPDRGTK